MIVKIFTKPLNYSIDKIYKKDLNEYLIGVEDGAFYAHSQNLELDLVIGDFDSIDKAKLEIVEKHAKKVKQFPIKKDYTDTYLAIKEALKLDVSSIIIYGGIGERFDHSYANILLLKLGPVTIQTDREKIYLLDPGHYEIENAFENISFFALEAVRNLSLYEFSYPLDKYDLDIDDPLCISNKGSGSIRFTKGLLLVIESSEN